MNIHQNGVFSNAITVAAGAAGTSNLNGSEVDMQDFDSVVAIVSFGPIVSGAATSLNWQQDTATGMGSAADLADTGITVADTNDNTIFVMSLHKPLERFVRIQCDRATQNSTVSAVYYRYNAKSLGTTQSSDVTTTEHHVTPIEGTA